MPDGAFTPDQREQILDRDGWCCARCGISIMGRLYSIQHRQARGMGGRKGANTIANGVTMCGTGTTGCHGWAESHPAQARETGWSIRTISMDDPEQIPLTDLRGRVFFLTDDGSVVILREAS